MLIVFGGLPGTGKTTVSRELAMLRRATWLRVDVIEQAIRVADVLAGEVGTAGYAVANALAEANLRLGRAVVIDAVNPVAESRAAWRGIARRTACPLIEVEVICSEAAEHRRRVETRESDIVGLVPPTWDEVMRRHYDAWPEPHIVIDTAKVPAEEAVRLVGAAMEAG